MTGKATRRGEEGSAFVISILVLFVLTVLGLAMMLTTTTEKDIAINYRWGEQAFFNADAALEYGKNILANYAIANGNFNAILPPPRDEFQSQVPDETADNCSGHPEGGCLPCDPKNAGCRDYQYHIDQCPGPPGSGTGPCTRIYIGRVLNRQDGTPAMYDFRAPAGTLGDLDGDGNPDIEGSFTLWVRRPMVGKRDYGLMPNENHDRVILTAEGTAPSGFSATAGRPVSVRRLEMSVRLPTAGVEGVKKSDSSNPDSTSDASGNMAGVTVP